MSAPITGLIAYWKFANFPYTEEYTGTYNLTKTGTPTIGTDRLGNTAGFSGFSGTKYFSHPSFLDAGLPAWTFFAWVKCPTGTLQSPLSWMVCKTGNIPYPFETFVMPNGTLGMNVSNTYPPNAPLSTSAINTGNWSLVVASGDSSGRTSLKWNINGGSSEASFSSTGTNSGAITANTDYDFCVGARNPGNASSPFPYEIGEMGFCNRVLTDAEKQRLWDERSGQYLVPNVIGNVTNNGNGMMAFFLS